tara:strand:- start:235 stop:501 length:267 start_codon:yes stop_codon:yes gene_type:complete
MVKATTNTRRNVNAKISAGQSASGIPQKVQVSVPSASSTNRLQSLQDVDTTTLEDGALLQYDATEKKFITRTTIDTTEGELVFNAGQF